MNISDNTVCTVQLTLDFKPKPGFQTCLSNAADAICNKLSISQWSISSQKASLLTEDNALVIGFDHRTFEIHLRDKSRWGEFKEQVSEAVMILFEHYGLTKVSIAKSLVQFLVDIKMSHQEMSELGMLNVFKDSSTIFSKVNDWEVSLASESEGNAQRLVFSPMLQSQALETFKSRMIGGVVHDPVWRNDLSIIASKIQQDRLYASIQESKESIDKFDAIRRFNTWVADADLHLEKIFNRLNSIPETT